MTNKRKPDNDHIEYADVPVTRQPSPSEYRKPSPDAETPLPRDPETDQAPPRPDR